MRITTEPIRFTKLKRGVYYDIERTSTKLMFSEESKLHFLNFPYVTKKLEDFTNALIQRSSRIVEDKFCYSLVVYSQSYKPAEILKMIEMLKPPTIVLVGKHEFYTEGNIIYPSYSGNNIPFFGSLPSKYNNTGKLYICKPMQDYLYNPAPLLEIIGTASIECSCQDNGKVTFLVNGDNSSFYRVFTKYPDMSDSIIAEEIFTSLIKYYTRHSDTIDLF